MAHGGWWEVSILGLGRGRDLTLQDRPPEVIAGFGRRIASVVRAVGAGFNVEQCFFVGQQSEMPLGVEEPCELRLLIVGF